MIKFVTNFQLKVTQKLFIVNFCKYTKIIRVIFHFKLIAFYILDQRNLRKQFVLLKGFRPACSCVIEVKIFVLNNTFYVSKTPEDFALKLYKS